MLLLGLLPAPCSASFLTLPEPLLQGSTVYSGPGPTHQTLIEKMAPDMLKGQSHGNSSSVEGPSS